MSLEEIFGKILADYCNVCNVESVPVTISIVDDMWEAYAQLRPDHAERQPESEEFQRTCNGTAVAPRDFNGMFTILLNKEYLMNSAQNNADWVGTLVHEAVHVSDFVQFAKIVGVTDYDVILERSNYRMFHLWTEFHAKAVGYYYIRKYTYENTRDVRQVKDIIETELPFHIEKMYEAYHSTNDGDRQMYYIVHFIGRMYVWQKLFPQYFTNRQIKKMFDSNVWMYELYVFLTTHTELGDAYKDFEEMQNILKQNFSGLD